MYKRLIDYKTIHKQDVDLKSLDLPFSNDGLKAHLHCKQDEFAMENYHKHLQFINTVVKKFRTAEKFKSTPEKINRVELNNCLRYISKYCHVDLNESVTILDLLLTWYYARSKHKLANRFYPSCCSVIGGPAIG